MTHTEIHNRLAAALAERPLAYLLTAGDDGRPHATPASARLASAPDSGSGGQAAIDGAVIIDRAGETGQANAGARPSVTVMCPPSNSGGYTLLIDGDALPDEQVAGRLVLEISRAVLHRPGPPSTEGASECGSDCISLS